MDVLLLSSPPTPHLSSSLRPSLRSSKPSPLPFTFNPVSSPLKCFPSLKTSLQSSQTLTPQFSAPQTPATAMRGAETDAMGLLLRERIVFLGNNIDDFVADAIISQLLLLDAQDPTKDIRLFINCPGGSLR